MLGEMTDRPEDASLINAIGHYWKPWFFKHVEDVLIKGVRGAAHTYLVCWRH